MPISNHVFLIPGKSVILTEEAARKVAAILERRETEIDLRGGTVHPELVNIRLALQNASADPQKQRNAIENWDDGISDELSTAEAADLIGVSDRHVRQLVARGDLTGDKRAGKLWLNRLEVEQHVNDRN